MRVANKKINLSHKDDFNRIIPVFPISVKQTSSLVSSDMETSKKKASKVIKKHSITAKPKRGSGTLSPKQREFYNKNEYCNWIDDSYLLLGRALYYQHNWYAAETAFEYIIKEFSNEPSRFMASIWIARTYTQLKKYNDAVNLLQSIEGEKGFPKKYRKELATSFADVYIQQKKYSDAIKWLEKSLKFTRKKKEKARYLYILAQLYQQLNQFPKAAEMYTKVIDLSPGYDMVFNAQINRATSVDQGINTFQVKKQLAKMLKDDKNIDYQDQIYYALGKINQKEKNEPEAVRYYKLSAKSSINNDQQKAISYLELANIYYEKLNYLPAQKYYDSCLTFLDNQYPNYEEIQLKSKNLTDLADNILTVMREDSLQRLAAMPEKDRNKIIDKIIEDIRAEEERKKLEEQQQQLNSMLFNQNQQNQQNTSQAGGKWYFYNPSAISFGASEFKRKWGNRKLEDNWRRKNKAIVMPTVNEEELADDDTTKVKPLDNKSREYYTQNLPLTDSLKTESNKLIENALFNAGEIYMNRFRNYNLSIEQFEILNQRFPETDFQLLCYYDLYRMNIFIENKDRAEYYKNLILQKFPTSKYANMLSNPNYLKELQEKQDEINTLYEESYFAYRKNRFRNVFVNYVKADSMMANNPVMPKFTLLRALSYGGIGKLPELKSELRTVIEKYPGSEEKTQAEMILAMVEKGDYSYLANRPELGEYNENATQLVQNNTQNTAQNTNQTQKTKVEAPIVELFSVEENESHAFAIIYPHKVVNLDLLKYNLFSFNTEFFIMFEFNVVNTRLDDTFSALTVKPFSSKKEATRYYKSVAKHKEIMLRKIEEKHLKYFVISDKNLTEITESKDYENYQKFFERNYLKKSK